MKNTIKKINNRKILLFLKETLDNKKLNKKLRIFIVITVLAVANKSALALDEKNIINEAKIEELTNENNRKEETKTKIKKEEEKVTQENTVNVENTESEILTNQNTEEENNRELTLEEKIAIILEREKLTNQQLIEVICTVLGEAGINYDECYNVISTINNRRLSYSHTNSVNRIFGENMGHNIYTQVICPHQFSAYNGNRYNYFISLPTEQLLTIPGSQSVIDCLYTLQSSHPYLSFRSAESNPEGKVQLTENGNLYFNQLTEENTISDAERINCAYGEAKNLYER